MNILTARRLFTFVREGTMYAEFNSVALFTVLYSRFKHCAKDVSTFTAQRTILEYNHNVKNPEKHPNPIIVFMYIFTLK